MGTTPENDRRGAERVAQVTVLVVDDSTAIRRILRRSLEGAGYRVTEAADGQQGIESCRADRPDLVLLDVDMPVMDGMATLSALRSDEALSGLPVLFLTARTGATDVALGLDLGAEDYLRKPCEPAELTARVASALRIKAREVALEQRAQDLDDLSTTDALTGLGNRRHLEARRSEIARATGPDTGVGMIIVDVDHFKKVNDEEGHVVGDVVLRILAGRLQSVVGDDATLVRWGGEEFLALTRDDSIEEVVSLGERFRKSIFDEPFSIGNDRTLEISVSVGCACGLLAGMEELVETADAALYEAKRKGRNRVAFRVT